MQVQQTFIKQCRELKGSPGLHSKPLPVATMHTRQRVTRRRITDWSSKKKLMTRFLKLADLPPGSLKQPLANICSEELNY